MVNRKRKTEKRADFQKPKLKVGKAKPLPENRTDTSFRSRGKRSRIFLVSGAFSITLLTQSVTVDKSNFETNYRNLTIGDLIAQVRHHNTGVRKEAWYGLIDLLDRHPKLLHDQTAVIVEAVARGIVDEDSAVRKGCLKLCREKLATLSQAALAPFLDLLVTVTCTAMTHIYDDINGDSVSFLALWLKLDSRLAERHRSKLLPNFFSLLKIGASAKPSHQKDKDNFTHIKRGTSGPRNRGSASLNIFICFSGIWSKINFQRVVFNSYPPTSNLLYHSPNTLLDAGTFLATMDAMGAQTSPQPDAFISTAILDLYPYLISTWVEISGDVFEGSSQLNSVTPDLAALHLVLRLVLWSWRFEDGSTRPEILDERFLQFQRHMMPLFPFGQNHRIANNANLVNLLHDMSSAVAEVSALYHLKARLSGRAADALKDASRKVVDYLILSLGDSSIPQERLVTLFPSLWWFLNGSGAASCRQLFQALMDFTMPMGSSGAQVAALEFLNGILIVERHPHYTGTFSLQKQPGFAAWVSNLGRSLSCLNPSLEPHGAVIKLVVNVLHHAMRFDPQNTINGLPIQLEVARLIKEGRFLQFPEPDQFHLVCGLYHSGALAPELVAAMQPLRSSRELLSSRLCERIDWLIQLTE
ncbi:rRNA processing protein [Massospora cicadina]|nr:rRNA processing protein [Massospora cicadina]